MVDVERRAARGEVVQLARNAAYNVGGGNLGLDIFDFGVGRCPNDVAPRCRAKLCAMSWLVKVAILT
jgi:hypothetical protein